MEKISDKKSGKCFFVIQAFLGANSLEFNRTDCYCSSSPAQKELYLQTIHRSFLGKCSADFDSVCLYLR